MGRTIGIDFGLKRTGLAISDPLGIIANGLDTVDSSELMEVLKTTERDVGFEAIVIGEPKRMSGEPSDIEKNILLFINALRAVFPTKKIFRFDERFTSKIAFETLKQAGISKSKRVEKTSLDKISATLILQEFLNKTRP